MFNMLFLTSLLIAIVSIQVEGVTVTSVSASPIINGSSVTLKFCDYSLSAGESITSIAWEFTAFGGTQAQMASYDTILNFQVSNDYRGRLTRPDPNSGFLHLTGMTTSDNGTYSCTVTTTVDLNSSTAMMLVFVPPESDGNLTLKQVNNELHCGRLISGGIPHVFLEIVESSSNTTLRESENLTLAAKWTQKGDYYCRAKWINFPDFIIPGVYNNPVITVRDFPVVTRVNESTLETEDGGNVTLVVNVAGDPPPEPSWSRAGTNVTSVISPGQVRASLTFTASRTEGDSQTVTCTAQDDVGFGSVTYTINIRGCSCGHARGLVYSLLGFGMVLIILCIIPPVLVFSKKGSFPSSDLPMVNQSGRSQNDANKEGNDTCIKIKKLSKTEMLLMIVILMIILMIVVAALAITVGVEVLDLAKHCKSSCPTEYDVGIAGVAIGTFACIVAIIIIIIKYKLTGSSEPTTSHL